MAARCRKEGLCDLSNVVAFGHNEQWRPNSAKVATKLAKILPVGNFLTNLVATFVAIGHHSSLWPKATTFEKSSHKKIKFYTEIMGAAATH